MKMKIGLLALFLSACATSNVVDNSLTYEKVRAFKVGVSKQADIFAALGSPTNQSEEPGRYTLIYDDPKTGAQRLSLTFAEDKLSSILWVPYEGEKEFSLVNVKAEFKNASFKEVIENIKNPHLITLSAVSYVDEKSGVTIRFDRNQNYVEAIAIFDPKIRFPADSEKREQIPYTFGDETSVKK